MRAPRSSSRFESVGEIRAAVRISNEELKMFPKVTSVYGQKRGGCWVFGGGALTDWV